MERVLRHVIDRAALEERRRAVIPSDVDKSGTWSPALGDKQIIVSPITQYHARGIMFPVTGARKKESVLSLGLQIQNLCSRDLKSLVRQTDRLNSPGTLRTPHCLNYISIQITLVATNFKFHDFRYTCLSIHCPLFV